MLASRAFRQASAFALRSARTPSVAVRNFTSTRSHFLHCTYPTASGPVLDSTKHESHSVGPDVKTETHDVGSLRTTKVSSGAEHSVTSHFLDPLVETESEANVRADEAAEGAIELKTTTKEKTETIVEEKHIPPKELGQDHHDARPHHPGKSDIEHFDDPTSSEEAVHADGLSIPSHELLEKGQGKKGKRSFSTSARSGALPARKEAEPSSDEDLDVQHPAKSDIPHLDKPTLSEEYVHADQLEVDPLGELKHTEESRYKVESAPIKVEVQPEDSVFAKKW